MKRLIAIIIIFSHSSCMMADEVGWAEKTLKQLTLKEKVGQLFMIGVSTMKARKSRYHFKAKEAERLIRECHVGNIAFFKGSAEAQVPLANHLQQVSKLPLLIAMDAEWGLAMRLADTISYPKAKRLAKVGSNLIYELGCEIGRQCRMVGVHINFAPVLDIRSTSGNVVIGDRAYGKDREVVATKGVVFMKGLQDGGVIACAKHFPGHGPTTVDSHRDLPVIKRSREQLFQEDLYPFKQAIDEGLGAIMPGHLSVPALDASKDPASVSRPILTELLQEELGFDGLIITDAIFMKGLMKYFKSEEQEAALRAIEAGNDVLLCVKDVESAVSYITQAVKDGRLDEKELDVHVLKILKAKEKMGLHENRFVEVEGLEERLNSDYAKDLLRRLR